MCIRVRWRWIGGRKRCRGLLDGSDMRVLQVVHCGRGCLSLYIVGRLAAAPVRFGAFRAGDAKFMSYHGRIYNEVRNDCVSGFHNYAYTRGSFKC